MIYTERKKSVITLSNNDKVLSSSLTCRECSFADALCKCLLPRSSLRTSPLLASVQFWLCSYHTIHRCYSLPRLFPETAVEKFPTDVIPLAEACIFYESKCALGCMLFCRKACITRLLCEKVLLRKWIPPVCYISDILRVIGSVCWPSSKQSFL